MNEINIGFVGNSYENFDMQKARSIISDIFNVISRKYCNDDNIDIKINIVTGATNMGIPKLVYEEASRFNMRWGEWLTLVGIMAKEGYECELFPCDEIYAYGNKFGEESPFFIDKIDVLYKIGGGEQSKKEFKMAQDKGIECFEFEL